MPGGSFLPTTSPARPLPESAGSPAVVRISDYITGSASPRIRRLARRIVRTGYIWLALLPKIRRRWRIVRHRLSPARLSRSAGPPADRSLPTTSPARPLPESAGLPGGSFGFRHITGSPLPIRRLAWRSFGFRLPHHRLGLPRIPRLIRQIVQLPTTSPARPLPIRRLAWRIVRFRLHHRLGLSRIPPAQPADGSLPTTSPARPLPKSAGLPGGSFSFRLSPALSQNPPACPANVGPTTSPARLSQNPAGSPGGSFRNPAGLPGGSFSFRLHHRLALSQNPAGSPGGWFGFRLHHRLAHRNLLSRRAIRTVDQPGRTSWPALATVPAAISVRPSCQRRWARRTVAQAILVEFQGVLR